MSFDVEPVEEVKVEAEVPYCRLHFCAMTRYKTKANGQKYYRCKVPGCKETKSIAPGRVRIPKEPTVCPICKTVMEVRKIGPYFVELECPGRFPGGLECGHRTEFARPDINDKIKKTVRRIGDVLDS